MNYEIRMGIPEMDTFWRGLSMRVRSGVADKNEEKIYRKLGKTLKLLSMNPNYPGLHSHAIDALTKRYGIKVWQSYLENHTGNAMRLFWVYGPEKNTITIIGLETHPDNSKNNPYSKIKLSKTTD